MSAQTSGNRVIFSDDFSNEGETARTGKINSEYWHFHAWSKVNDTSHYGATQQRSMLPIVSNGMLELQLDTFNPTGNPNKPDFYGSEAITNKMFDVGDGLAFEARMRLGQDQPGLIGGFFGYNIGPTPNAARHDEIDFEMISNQINEIQTNIYKNEPLGNGHAEFHPVTGSLTDFHTYRIEWLPNFVRWFVDGELVRTETERVPTKELAMHLNLWVGGADWPSSHRSLQPVGNRSENTTYELYVDSVKVERLSSDIGTAAAESLQGTASNDHLAGQNGSDQLLGDAGHDTVYGGGGVDQITGGIGADTLWGGSKADTFVYTRVEESTVDPAGRDTIEDFSHLQGDKIDLSAIDANVGLAGDQAFSFIGASAFHQSAGELRFEIVAGQTYVSGDVTGDGVADFMIHLRGQHTIDAGYFVL